MKIVVTGGAGFIGSNFINYELKHHEDDLICFDSLTYAGNLNNLDYVKNNSRLKNTSAVCDIADALRKKEDGSPSEDEARE